MQVTFAEAISATSAVAHNPERAPHECELSTDTRSLRPGQTYLALRGENFDGHDYVARAVAAGAAAIVVDRPDALLEGVPALLVADTKQAYMQIARAARMKYGGRVVAITGSAGKTTTKALLEQLLIASYGEGRVYASPANENNEIGVSKLLLALEPKHDVAIVEMGARHPGDIAALVEIALPHVGVLTNVGEAHLEIFGSRQALADTKWGLFSTNSQAVLNAGDAVSRERADSLAKPPRWFGLGSASQPGTFVDAGDVLRVTDASAPFDRALEVPFPGKHNRANLAAAIAAARLAGASLDTLCDAVPSLRLPAGRYERTTLESGLCVIFDAYNANMSGMVATLDAFAEERAPRRIAVLGSMAELGSESSVMHRSVGAHAASTNVDALLVGGEFANDVAAGATDAGFPIERIVHFQRNDDAAAWLRRNARAGDVVLLKGSRKYKLEEIVEALKR